MAVARFPCRLGGQHMRANRGPHGHEQREEGDTVLIRSRAIEIAIENDVRFVPQASIP